MHGAIIRITRCMFLDRVWEQWGGGKFHASLTVLPTRVIWDRVWEQWGGGKFHASLTVLPTRVIWKYRHKVLLGVS